MIMAWKTMLARLVQLAGPRRVLTYSRSGEVGRAERWPSPKKYGKKIFCVCLGAVFVWRALEILHVYCLRSHTSPLTVMTSNRLSLGSVGGVRRKVAKRSAEGSAAQITRCAERSPKGRRKVARGSPKGRRKVAERSPKGQFSKNMISEKSSRFYKDLMVFHGGFEQPSKHRKKWVTARRPPCGVIWVEFQ